ncbi:Rho GTPase-activating protein 12 [Bagarius yarrelli]|uniref:Rho GTPase-activating protein 12 n=1 Tax=Bagarius yarrelli TaxID=175774 RepID=A0A556V7K0_BAGYA|nr:Rho GTPase-activating protein 12 [Bagarius yarrelli]
MADRSDLPVAPGQPYIEVEYDYEYKSKERMITIKQGECFLLVKKTNEDWWQVRKEEGSKPFYVPAQYVREVRRALMPPTKAHLHTESGIGTRGGFEKKTDESLNKKCLAQSPYAGYLVAMQAPTENKTSPKTPIRLQAPMDSDGETDRERERLGDASIGSGEKERKKEERFNKNVEKTGDGQKKKKKEGEREGDGENGRKVEGMQHKSAASEKSPGEVTEKNRSDLESGIEFNISSTELQGRPDSPVYTNQRDLKISQSSLPPLPLSPPTLHAEWETCRDSTGRHFYYNRTTQEHRWKPPRLRDSFGKMDEKHVTATTESEPCEKSGPLNVTKITEHGKKVRKNWTSSWTILQGSQLIFAKSQAMATSWFGGHQSKPDFSVDLKGAIVDWASKEKSSKKHVLEVKTHRGPELLIQSDNETVINEWLKALSEAINIHAWESDEAIEEDMPESLGVEKNENENHDQQKKTKTRLKKFLIRRPSLQAVKDKGYIKDLVFGCNLISLCQREKTTVPRFVKMCIDYIENEDEKINLSDSKWEDIHVATGALKMFFRELPEPLFTYVHFNDFFNAIIIEHGEQNRMTTQSVAIVFGPTLLRPETENIHMAVHMVYQNQIVELILHEYETIFGM